MVERALITIRGAVQGVGFRPFIYRLAAELDIKGWVNNSAQGVTIEAEAPRERLDSFIEQIKQQKPAHALIQSLNAEFLAPAGHTAFEIRHSDSGGGKTALILPDLATCPACLSEILDPANRRYRYPFTNCTYCGPRFSIIHALPYDRPNTTMRAFPMCDECRAEYENPLDRRFHAQPTACPKCGPQLALWDSSGATLAERDDALLGAAEWLRQGKIVAVKGLGGFHLMADARHAGVVARLRARKGREEKPLALMFPDLEQVAEVCAVSELERGLLQSAEAPIVLLKRETGESGGADEARLAPTNDGRFEIAANVAPGNPYLGVMLPYTPLHHLLMRELGFPVVATSGNLSGEPICTDEHDALERLGEIADGFLVHNRPIARHVDDSIVRVAAGREMMLRRARGYAPLPLELPQDTPPLIATGAHLKNVAAMSVGRSAFASQHIGDMDTPEAFDAFQRVIADFQRLYELTPSAGVCDLHPDYRSTQYAESLGLPVIRVQHHYAHALACLADNGIHPPALAVTWDGTGYGLDGTIWGGEFLRVGEIGFERLAHLMTFRLPGGDQAVREPRRSALGLLYAIFGDNLPNNSHTVHAFSPTECKLLLNALQRGVNAPVTSSAGRLFDAVASLVGLRQRAGFEGQAAMELEFAAEEFKTDKCYPFNVTDITGSPPLLRRTIDVTPMIVELLDDVQMGIPAGEISATFHNTLAEITVAVARLAGEPQVVLSGGCFQNRMLLESTVERLERAGFRPFWHRRIPPNDGGIAVGQIVAAVRDSIHVSGSSGEDTEH